MKAGALFRLPGFGKQKSIDFDSFLHSLLDSLPQAALIIDKQSQLVTFANLMSAELSSYTRAELTGLKLASLFDDWEDRLFEFPEVSSSSTNIAITEHTIPLINRNRQSIPVHIKSIDLGSTDHRTLIILQPSQEFQLKHTKDTQSWEFTRHLLSAQGESSPEIALTMAMEAGRNLLGADSIALYRARESSPELVLTHTSGKSYHLPKILPPQDLVYLNKPNIWNAGRRTNTALTRAARIENLKYLITAPIGPSFALIGLVAIIGENNPHTSNSLAFAEIIAGGITSIIQHHSQLDMLKDEIRSWTRKEIISKFLQASMSEGYLVLKPDLSVKDVNKATELLFGYSSSEVINQPVDQILIADQPMGPALSAAQNSSPTYNLGNIHLYRRNGESFLAHIRIFPVVTNDHVSEIIVFIQDLSGQEQMRRQAQEFEQRAVLGEVTAVFAHEIRNPINNISTGLQLMAYNLPKDDQNQETVQRMLQDCDRLEQLIKSVLSFSRPTDYEMEALDLPKTLDRLLKPLQIRLKRSNIKYEMKFDPNCPPVLGNQRGNRAGF